jgi:hypothetical protein
MSATGRPPACKRCGGTGYVYLWSVAANGAQLWFCDRSGCKRFWSDVAWTLSSLASNVALEPGLSLDASSNPHVLQPA